jgi:tartrate/fumarate subfamily iron-sulfur-dependent hydro-lyase beta chain
LLHLFLYDLIFSILLHIVNHLHELLAQFISLLHGRGLAIYADDRLGITLAEVNPLVREIELDAIDICYGDILLLTIHLLNLHEDSIYIGRWSQVDAVLGDEIVREAGTEFAHLAALVSQTAQEEGDTNEGITTIMALWIDNSTISFTVKLASIKYYDELPTTGDETGRAFRDIDLENKLLEEAHKIGLGAQFGGKYLAHDIRVIRLPRHGASCPIGMGVSCSADRNIKAKINKDGIWLEKMDENPTELIPEELRNPGEGTKGIEIDLDKGIDAVRAELSKYPVSTRVNLKGTIIVARDIAHAKLKARLDAGEEMPEYFKNHPILYAGPAKTPEGYPCGSMGPTTANRMDPYVDEFQDHGASLVMIAKGNRGDVVTEACKKHGGFYLGTIGGVAAVLSQSSIKSIECVEYPELGMEAIWKITVEDFPAFILVDDKGNDFFKQLKPWTPCKECQK